MPTIAPLRDPVARLVATIAIQTRHGAPQTALDELRRELTEAILARRISEGLAAHPPLTSEQRERLAALLLGGAR